VTGSNNYCFDGVIESHHGIFNTLIRFEWTVEIWILSSIVEHFFQLFVFVDLRVNPDDFAGFNRSQFEHILVRKLDNFDCDLVLLDLF